MRNTSNLHHNHLATLIGNSLGKAKPACLASVYACVTVRLSARSLLPCGRAGAVDASKSSTLGDEIGLIEEPAWGVFKWEGPARQGVITPLAARSCALTCQLPRQSPEQMQRLEDAFCTIHLIQRFHRSLGPAIRALGYLQSGAQGQDEGAQALEERDRP